MITTKLTYTIHVIVVLKLQSIWSKSATFNTDKKNISQKYANSASDIKKKNSFFVGVCLLY